MFSNGKETLNFTLAPGASATFKWRLAILSRGYGVAEIEALAKDAGRRALSARAQPPIFLTGSVAEKVAVS